MDPDRTLLLIGGNDEMVNKAKALGLHVLVVQHPEKVDAAPCDGADLVRVADFTDLAALEGTARELYETHGFAAAQSLTEPGLEGAGWINDRLLLGGTGYAVTRVTRDKWAMRRRLAAARLTGSGLTGSGLATIGAEPLTTRTDMDMFAASYGYPFVVKPVDGTGSYGVFLVDGPDAAGQVWRQVAALRDRRMQRATLPLTVTGFLMEEYAAGPQFSLECFSFAGRHVVIGITEQLIKGFTPVGQALPARLNPAVETALRRAGRRFLDVIGLRDGPSHTEVRLTRRGPAIIETHNRMGGGGIGAMVPAVYGVDMMSYTMGWPFRLVPELPEVPEPRAGAATLVLLSEPGLVESVTGVAAALAAPDVLAVQIEVRPGDRVRSLRDGWDRLGLVMASGADTRAAVRRIEELLRDTIRIQIRGDDGSIRPVRLGNVAAGTGAQPPVAVAA